MKYPLKDASYARKLIRRGHNDFPDGELCPDELQPSSWIMFHGRTGITIQMDWKSGRQDAWAQLDVPESLMPEIPESYQQLKQRFENAEKHHNAA
jgi:hypothetical protein